MKTGVIHLNKDQNGCFIVFEGIDGAGKSKQVYELAVKLKKRKYESITTHEPNYESTLGKMIRRVLNKSVKVSDPSLALLFAADRVEHTKNQIIPNLKNSSIVICDRYIYSSLAYQTGGMDSELDIDWVYQINKHTIKPDIVFFLDISAEESFSRLKEGQKRVVDDDYFESLSKQKRIRNQYYKIFDLENETYENSIEKKVDGVKIIIIDGTLKIEVISSVIEEYVINIIKEKKIPKKSKRINVKTSLLDFVGPNKE